MLQPIIAGFIAAISGFASSFALVIAGLAAVGASDRQAASGLLAVCLAIAAVSIVSALWLRVPLAIAWSTPGAAVLLAAAGNGVVFSDAVGAFLVSSGLVLLCGVWPALGRAITGIPKPLASALLAGVLFRPSRPWRHCHYWRPRSSSYGWFFTAWPRVGRSRRRWSSRWLRFWPRRVQAGSSELTSNRNCHSLFRPSTL